MFYLGGIWFSLHRCSEFVAVLHNMYSSLKSYAKVFNLDLLFIIICKRFTTAKLNKLKKQIAKKLQ